ncbi:MAG TPA: YcdB/YcdC domain-containing protein, partial [Symbiobacteriaceae bacterium]|nr:YcdB/YcdC domain-containing protein [Symbiobacteriaceae bacterium]
IVNYSLEGKQQDQTGALKYSRGEAYKLAAQWLDKLGADVKASLQYLDDPLEYGFYGGGTVYRFHWDRMEQGYPVSNQGLDIVINATNGNLQSYYRNWGSTLQAKLPEAILEQSKADAAYQEQLPLLLQYQRFTKPGTEASEIRLVYRPLTGWFPSVGMDGKLLDNAGQPLDVGTLPKTQLVPAADKPYQKPAQLLTADEALAVALAVSGRKDQPNNVNCNEYGKETKTRTCEYSWNDQEKQSYYSVQVDLVTGLVVNLSGWDRSMDRSYMEKFVPKVNKEQAYQMGVDFIRQFRPDLAGTALGTVYEEKGYEGQIVNYRMQFQYTHEYVPIADRAATVQVDARTGTIRYFWSEASTEEKVEYPAVEGLITTEKAIASFLTHKGLELRWVTFYDYEPYLKESETAKEPETKLVWVPRTILPVEFIEAKTAALLDFRGRDVVELAKRPSDIDGHFAQREIELLWARGVFELTDGKFNPNEVATAADLARWLVLVRGLQPYLSYDYAMSFGGKGAAAENFQRSAEAPYLGAALQAGILLPEDFPTDADPAEPISRELFALWSIRAMGYAEIAKMENRIEMSFQDKATIGARYANAVALLDGLNVLQAEAFRPQAKITRAEAAQILFAVAARARMYPVW